MAEKAQNHHENPKKAFALRLNRQLMLDIQHLALDQDRYASDLVEEALKDILKKYAGKAK